MAPESITPSPDALKKAEQIVNKFLDAHGFQVVSSPPAQHPLDAVAELISTVALALDAQRSDDRESSFLVPLLGLLTSRRTLPVSCPHGEKVEHPPLMPDPLDLAAIRRRCEQATSGPWFHYWNKYRGVYDTEGSLLFDVNTNVADSDAIFIAHARQDLPALLDALEAAVKVVEAGKKLEAAYDDPGRFLAISNARHDWREALAAFRAQVKP